VIAANVFELVFRSVVVVVLATATTIVSLRLLGVRRGWPAAVTAGVLGWALAGVVALGLADWDWGADGLVVYTLALAVPATMASAVAVDLAAPPGSLAIGERAGLVVTPRPMHAVRLRLEIFRRYRELLGLLRREGFRPSLTSGLLEGAPEEVGVRLRRVLEQAGGAYIKLGQIAATRIDLIPAPIADELAKLQNRVPPEPTEVVAEVLEEELDGDVEKIFAEFDWEPLAAASIGQTHRARLHSGEAVVVKVQRRDIAMVMARDLAALSLLADVAQRRTVLGQGVRSGDLLGQFAESLRAELDFRREADAMVEMAAVLADTPVRVPKVYPELTTRRVLVQERFEGHTVSDLAGDGTQADRRGLADQLLRAMLAQILQAGFFHADPHPGNVFALPDGTLGLIDFGAVGRLDSLEQAAVVDMLAAVVRGDVSLLRDAIERVADVADSGPPEQLERALARLLADNVRPGGAVDPAILQDLVTMLARFDVRLPGDLVILSRAVVTLDGTLRVLDPDFHLVGAATAAVTSPTTPALDRDALIRAELEAALPHLRRLPDRVDRILTLTSRGDLRLRTVIDEDGRRVLRTLVNRALLALAGAAFLAVSATLLVASDEGPAVAEGTGLFEVLGFGGLVIGTVLLLRVVAAVARDGTT
jgi:ubiquinone biosynthesis protein